MPNPFENRRVLVTGANGFLSGWITKRLLEENAAPVALVYEKNPVSVFERERLHEKTEVVKGDLRNFDLLKLVIQKYRIQTVFHIGAQAICALADKNPKETLDTNVMGTYNVLEAVRVENPDCHVIVASSDKAYGDHDILPYTEEHDLRGSYPYDVSKTCTDLIAQMYWKSFRLPVSIVRCGNLYGGGDAHFSRIIPATVKRLHQGLRPVVFNDSTRDFLHIQDAVSGYFSIAKRMTEGACHGEAFNFGTETPRTMYDVADLIATIMEKSHLRPERRPIANPIIKHQYLSSKKAHAMLDWKPNIPFENGLRETVRWYVEYFKDDNADPKTLSEISDYEMLEEENALPSPSTLVPEQSRV